MLLEKIATARKKQTIRIGIDIKSHAIGSNPEEQSTWKTPVPITATRPQCSIPIMLPITR
jgi:hypothetical protein